MLLTTLVHNESYSIGNLQSRLPRNAKFPSLIRPTPFQYLYSSKLTQSPSSGFSYSCHLQLQEVSDITVSLLLTILFFIFGISLLFFKAISISSLLIPSRLHLSVSRKTSTCRLVWLLKAIIIEFIYFFPSILPSYLAMRIQLIDYDLLSSSLKKGCCLLLRPLDAIAGYQHFFYLPCAILQAA